MLRILPEYPSDAARGACYLSGASRGEITETDPDTGESRTRPERVIDTGREIDFEGRLCVGEAMIRHLAHELGMLDDWRVRRLIVEHEAVVAENLALSTRCNQLEGSMEVLRDMAQQQTRNVHVAADGTLHTSARAAENASRHANSLPSRGRDAVRPITAAEAPIPAPAQEHTTA